MITVETWQDGLGGWHAVINSDGNTLAEFPPRGNYGFHTEKEAVNAANNFVSRKKNRNIDIEGGGAIKG